MLSFILRIHCCLRKRQKSKKAISQFNTIPVNGNLNYNRSKTWMMAAIAIPVNNVFKTSKSTLFYSQIALNTIQVKQQ